MSPLRRRFSLGLTLLAWFFASGSQWDAVQVFAWMRMFATNAETMPLGEALVRTFSPEERCELCRAVTAGKQTQESSAVPGAKFEDKSLLLYEPAPVMVTIAPPTAALRPENWRLISIARERPPVPPPRAS